MASSLGYSQSLPFNFSSANQLFFGDNCVTSLTTDAGNDVMQVVGSGQNFDNAQIVLAQNLNLSDNANNTITFRFKQTSTTGSGSHLLKFENGTGGPATTELPFTSTGTGWNNISLDFPAGLGNYGKVVIFTDFNNPTAGTYLVDDLAGGTNVTPPPPLPTPSGPAPVPTLPASTVISMYGESYPNTFLYSFGTATDVDLDASAAVNNALKIDLSVAGFGAGYAETNVSTMQFVHFDYWTSNATTFSLYLISNNPVVERIYNLPANQPIVQNAWTSVNIPLSFFTSQGFNPATWFQYKFDNASPVAGTIDFDKIVQENKDNGALGSTDVFAASNNDHNWYGVLSTLNTELSDNLTLTAGLDGRYYVGSHYYSITDLLGGEYYLNPSSNDNNKNTALKVGDRFNRDYEGRVLRYGTFAQLEYSQDALSVFLSSSISNTRYGRSSFLDDSSNPNGNVSDNANFLGYGIKGGANYNVDDTNNVFANIGYFSRAPFLTGSVFLNKESVELNSEAINEKVFSAEIGYGYRSENFNANINLYRTSWLDKSITARQQDPDNLGQFLEANIAGLDALHQGIEFDFVAKLSDKLNLTGMFSLGDWTWQSDVQGQIFDQNNVIIKEVTVNAKGLKVNDAAQTTYALGINYKVLDRTNLFIDYNYAGDLYSKFNITRSIDRENTWKMPGYHLADFGFRHGFTIGDFYATLSGKMNNIFDVEYISDAFDDGTHTASGANVYYGAGRTFSLGLKVNF